MKRFAHTMLSAASTDETTATFTPENGEIPQGYTHIVEWGTSVSAGEVVIEGARTAAGPFVAIHTFTYSSGAPKTEYVFSSAMFPVMQHRINTAVSGGTVTTALAGAR